MAMLHVGTREIDIGWSSVEQLLRWVGTHFQKQISRTFLGLRLIFPGFQVSP